MIKIRFWGLLYSVTVIGNPQECFVKLSRCACNYPCCFAVLIRSYSSK